MEKQVEVYVKPVESPHLVIDAGENCRIYYAGQWIDFRDGKVFVDRRKHVNEVAQAKENKMFLTEILNDLYRYGHVKRGKADTMLRDWAKELRDLARPIMPPSRLRRTFDIEVGAQNW